MRRLALAAVLLALVVPARAAAFAPSDPLAAKQWYLAQDRAFAAWTTQPDLEPVRVAVIDSGIDGSHPEFAGRIAAHQSFVGGSALTDEIGHGTFVAGEIAADLDGHGTAGIAFPAQLLVAKIVRPDGSISLGAESRAIHWAVANGAQVINLSLGGVRDPFDPSRDGYSQLEADAVSYAVASGVVVVAAAGNSDAAPRVPWNFASYPAALPHVIGVSALARDGSVPDFSDRDRIYDDIAAPGQDMLSTFPRALTAAHTGCTDQGYSDCGSDEYRAAEGTSFAAPQVSAAAALLLSVHPELTADQIAALVERSADDVSAATGCDYCPTGRDRFTGWGRLDVAAALAAANGPLPVADTGEPNDGPGSQALRMWGLSRRVRATLDYWDDPVDVYEVKLYRGQRLAASVRGPAHATAQLSLWKPGTRSLGGLSLVQLRQRAARSTGSGPVPTLVYRVRRSGWYSLEVQLATPGAGPYTLAYAKR